MQSCKYTSLIVCSVHSGLWWCCSKGVAVCLRTQEHFLPLDGAGAGPSPWWGRLQLLPVDHELRMLPGFTLIGSGLNLILGALDGQRLSIDHTEQKQTNKIPESGHEISIDHRPIVFYLLRVPKMVGFLMVLDYAWLEHIHGPLPSGLSWEGVMSEYILPIAFIFPSMIKRVSRVHLPESAKS